MRNFYSYSLSESSTFNRTRELDWGKLIDSVRIEHELSLRVLPARMTEQARLFAERIRNMRAVFTIPGARAGCICAICYTPEEREGVREIWEPLIDDIPNARVLGISIDPKGLIIERRGHSDEF